MASLFSEERWTRAFKDIETLFEIDNLLDEQKEPLQAFIEKGNVFVNLPTGYGKSLIFQCLPIHSLRKATMLNLQLGTARLPTKFRTGIDLLGMPGEFLKSAVYLIVISLNIARI